METRYRMTLESQLGPRTGLLRLEDAGGRISGVLSLLGFDNTVSGRLDAHRMRLTHGLRTAVSVLNCESILDLDGSILTGTLRTEGYEMRWHGELLK